MFAADWRNVTPTDEAIDSSQRILTEISMPSGGYSVRGRAACKWPKTTTLG